VYATPANLLHGKVTPQISVKFDFIEYFLQNPKKMIDEKNQGKKISRDLFL
jgi:hypothetical protein